MKRYSQQRETILNIVKATDCHPSAGYVYEHARRTIPNISLGTVYRNLSELRKSGHIISLTPGDGTERFDGNTEDHHHFCCKVCGSVSDIQLPVDKELNQKAQRSSGNRVDFHRTIFYGICRDCNNKLQEEK